MPIYHCDPGSLFWDFVGVKGPNPPRATAEVSLARVGAADAVDKMQLKYAVEFVRFKLDAASKEQKRVMVTVTPADHASLQPGKIMQPASAALQCSVSSDSF